MVKVDYNTDIYKKIVTDTDDKIIGWVTDDENPEAYDFDGKKIGQAITDEYAKKDYNRMVYTKIKENSNGFYEPAKGSKEIGKVTGNITRVMFKKVNDNFKLHLALIAGMMKYDTYDDYHDADDEKNSSVYQYKKGMDKFFDNHIDNSKLGLDSGSIKAAKGQFFGSIDNCDDADSVTKLLKDTIKQSNMLTGKNVELDKDGNIEINKINTLILNYNVLIVNMAILLAITVVAVVANKKKKGNDPTSINPTAYSATGPAAGSGDPVIDPSGITAYSATGPAAGSGDPVTDPSGITAYSATGPAAGLSDQAGSADPTDITAYSATGPAAGLSDPVTDLTGITAYSATGPAGGSGDPVTIPIGPTAVPGPSLADQFIFNSAFSDLINSIY